jgi:hypothetical protein
MLAAERWTLTHRSVCAVGLALGLGLPVLVAASSVADAEAEVAESDGEGEYGPSGVCRRELDGEGDSVAPAVAVAEGLGDGVGDGVGEGDGDGDGEGDGEGEGEAVAGNAWHCLSVAVAGVADLEAAAASALSCRLVNTPRVRNPPVSKLIVAALTYPKRIRIALSALLVRVTVCSS